MEENSSADQKYQWKQNWASGAIDEEVKQIKVGASGSKRSSDQRDSKNFEFWFTEDPKTRVQQNTPTKGGKKTKSRSSPSSGEAQEEEHERFDREALRTSIKTQVGETSFEDVEMVPTSTSIKLHETVLAPTTHYKKSNTGGPQQGGTNKRTTKMGQKSNRFPHPLFTTFGSRGGEEKQPNYPYPP